MLPNAISVYNAKGGVGKTSLAANIAQLLAVELGWKVLLVDLDKQADLAVDLGYVYNAEEERGDGGAALFHAFLADEPLTEPPLVGVRDNLDVVPGGDDTSMLRTFLSKHFDNDRPEDYAHHGVRMHRVLAELAPQYQLIIFDCPPDADSPVAFEALGASKHVLIPTKADTASTDGITLAAQTFAVLSGSNPDLEVVGVVLFGAGSTSTKVVDKTRALVESIATEAGWRPDAFFPAWIRSSDVAMQETRELGMTATEWMNDRADVPLFVPHPDDPKARIPNPVRTSTAAAGLADDYLTVVETLLQRI